MRVEGGGKYQVKLVPTNCTQEEVIFETVAALDHLNAITAEIFGSIRTRIAKQRETMSSISTRVVAISEKVNSLESTTKALQITSSAKFPEVKDEAQSESLSIQSLPALSLKTLPPQRTITDSFETMAMMKRQRIAYDPPVKNPDELLHYHRVRDYNYAKGSNLAQLETAYEPGLGHPPPELNLIDSFLLFNTAENPYQHYRVLERTGGSNALTKAARRAAEERGAAAEKASMDKNSTADGLASGGVLDDFYYSPSSAQIPDLDVPDHLPNLPGLADTLDFPTLDTSNSLFSITRPSTLSTSTSTTWGTSPSNTITPITPVAAPAVGQPSTSTPISRPQTSVPVPPPPPPPPMSGVPPPPPFPTPAAVPVVSGGIPPPPPPPPPPPMQISVTPAASTAAPPSTKHLVGGGPVDLRSSLMAAIREAGGSGKLSGQSKRHEARRKKQEEKEKAEAAGGGSDLMADLKNSLAMRRRGISGMNDAKQPGLGDIMQKMASSIPMAEDSLDSGPSGDEDWD